MADKKAIADAADFCEAEAEKALDRGVEFSAAHGPQAGLSDLERAGSLLAAAEALRKRAE